MKILVLLCSLFLTFNVFANCPMNFKEASLCADLEWIDGPYLDKKSHFRITFWDKEDSSNTPASPNFEVDIYSWMIMHGGHSHGGPRISVNEISEGVFEVKDARFFMGGMRGYWEIRADLKDGDQLVSRSSSRVYFKKEK